MWRSWNRRDKVSMARSRWRLDRPSRLANGPIAIASGDFEFRRPVPGPGRVVNSTDSTISVFLNNGDATFAEATGSPLTTSAGANPSGVAIARFHERWDRRSIAVTNQGVSTLGVLRRTRLRNLLAANLNFRRQLGRKPSLRRVLDATGLPERSDHGHSGHQ